MGICKDVRGLFAKRVVALCRYVLVARVVTVFRLARRLLFGAKDTVLHSQDKETEKLSILPDLVHCALCYPVTIL